MSEVVNSPDTKTETLPVAFTETAKEELHRLHANLELKQESVLRIGVKGGGCSGMSYLLAFDKIFPEVYFVDISSFFSSLIISDSFFNSLSNTSSAVISDIFTLLETVPLIAILLLPFSSLTL